MMVDRDLTDGEMKLLKTIVQDSNAAAMCVEEGRMLSAFEHLHVAQTCARTAMRFEPGTMTEDLATVIGKVAWAQAGLLSGDTTRLYDDLLDVETHAERVSNGD